MVIEDYRDKESSRLNNSSSYQARFPQYLLAQPVDRLAATVIDLFIVLMPVLLLATAPFKRQLTEAILMENEADLLLASTGIVILIWVGVIFYQSLFHHTMGATLGKLFMNLRVVHYWNGKAPTYKQSLLRAISWWFGIFGLGFPFLTIMSQPLRRSLHDQVSDTIVISLKSSAGSPRKGERVLVAMAFSMIIFLFSSYAFLQFSFIYANLKDGRNSLFLFSESAQFCQSVSDITKKDDSKQSQRLTIAMTLYSTGLIDIPCLQAEAELAFRKKENPSLAYLAQSFVYADHAELSNAYLDKVCEVSPDSENCKLTQVINFWDEDNSQEVRRAFLALKKNKIINPYVAVWVIQHFVKTNEYKGAMDLLEELELNPQLASFVNRYRVKTLWASHKKEKAEDLSKVVYNTLEKSQRLELASWVCYDQLSDSCEATSSRHCQVMSDAVKEQPGYLDDNNVALTYFKNMSCQDKKLSLTALTEKIPNALIREFFPLLDKHLKLPSSDELIESVLKISEDNEWPSKVRHEALRQLMNSKLWNKASQGIIFTWEQLEPNADWRKTGEILFDKLYQSKSYREASWVAIKLENLEHNNVEFQKKAIVAWYKSGLKDKARKFLALFFTKNSRQPASNNEFSQVKKQMESQ